MRTFITGDCHGVFDFLPHFCKKLNTTTEDILIILGDAGINYWCDSREKKKKRWIAKQPITLLCIHGNHEVRPANIPTYHKKYIQQSSTGLAGFVYQEEEFPNVLFATNGILHIGNKRFLVMDGAYSVDKYYRLANGWHWWPDEQMPKEEMDSLWRAISFYEKVDYVLSHAAPIDHEPTYLFLSEVDQSQVDKTTEHFLQRVCDKISFDEWYYGHYHDDRKFDDNFRILFSSILELETGEEVFWKEPH